MSHCLIVYDATRGGLLRGRKTMLKLCAAQLKQQASALKADEDLVWIDIGGGTGMSLMPSTVLPL